MYKQRRHSQLHFDSILLYGVPAIFNQALKKNMKEEQLHKTHYY